LEETPVSKSRYKPAKLLGDQTRPRQMHVTGRGKLIADKIEKAGKARKNPRTDKAGS